MEWEKIRRVHSWLPAKPEGWRQHPDGGWVEDTALVEPGAVVKDYALVGQHAVVRARAIVRDKAVVLGHAIVCGGAVVRDHAHVSDWAVIAEGAVVGGKTSVMGRPWIYGRINHNPLCLSGLPDNANTDGEYVRIGYHRLTPTQWLGAEGQAIAEAEGITPELMELYRAFARLCQSYQSYCNRG